MSTHRLASFITILLSWTASTALASADRQRPIEGEVVMVEPKPVRPPGPNRPWVAMPPSDTDIGIVIEHADKGLKFYVLLDYDIHIAKVAVYESGATLLAYYDAPFYQREGWNMLNILGIGAAVWGPQCRGYRPDSISVLVEPPWGGQSTDELGMPAKASALDGTTLTAVDRKRLRALWDGTPLP